MVECMEAWFIADMNSLAKYFGQNFNPNALPGNQQVETIAKLTVLKSLKDATRNCTSKGAYRKGKHSFELLGQINPSKVRKAAPYADRLLELLETK